MRNLMLQRTCWGCGQYTDCIPVFTSTGHEAYRCADCVEQETIPLGMSTPLTPAARKAVLRVLVFLLGLVIGWVLGSLLL